MNTVPRAPAGADVRSRVRRVLGAAALEPPGLPPAAVLVVRSLADPLPGRLAPRPGDVRAPAAWESAVRGALAEQWRGAARPARDAAVPPTAGAVYFADTAEMIAAFARDAAAGDVGRWWWRALLPGLPGGPVAALASLWAREARHVPAAVELLADTGDAARVLTAFSAPQVARILAAIAWAWDAPGLAAAPPAAWNSKDAAVSGDERRPMPSAGSTTAAEDAEDAERPRASAPGDAARGPAPPWRGFLPVDAVPPALGTESAALLGLSLMLHRAPHVARGSGFVARFVRWRAEAGPSAASGPRAPAPPRAESASISPEAAPRVESTGGTRPRSGDARAESGSAAGIGRIASPEAVVAADARPPGQRDAIADRDASPEIDPVEGGRAMAIGERMERAASSPSTADTDAVDGAGGRGAEDAAARIHRAPPADVRAASGACGIFFLVNVLRSIGFHRALDEHFATPPIVGGWGWTELVARALLGPRAGGLVDDAVWRLLAELDGRAPDEPAGGGFIPPAAERLPDAWTDLFRGAPPAPEPSPLLGRTAAPHLQRFLDVVIPPIRARIRAALAAAGGDAEEPLETLLFRRTGTVEATRTHVDVRMELDQATLPVRLAGLDASPGWVPELARVVTFYFV